MFVLVINYFLYIFKREGSNDEYILLNLNINLESIPYNLTGSKKKLNKC